MNELFRAAFAGLAASFILVVVLLGIAYLIGDRRVSRTYAIRPAPLAVPADSASLARGERLARVHFCAYCHGDELGGAVFADELAFRLVASNLTPGRGGVGASYTEADWLRALLHGVGPERRPLVGMPSQMYARLSDADAAALVAYLDQLPPVDHELPPTEIRLAGYLLAALGGLPYAVDQIDHTRLSVDTPPPGPTAAYGTYLAATACTHCHGAGLRGGLHPHPDAPPAPDLAPAAGWSFDAFARTLRTGVTPTGGELDPTWMPWKYTRHYTDEELRALHAYLQALPAP